MISGGHVGQFAWPGRLSRHPCIPPLDAAGLGSMLSYRIPVSQLVEAYPWTSGGPNSWSEATVHGIYIGIEVWGPASVSTELSNYRLYSVGVGN